MIAEVWSISLVCHTNHIWFSRTHHKIHRQIISLIVEILNKIYFTLKISCPTKISVRSQVCIRLQILRKRSWFHKPKKHVYGLSTCSYNWHTLVHKYVHIYRDAQTLTHVHVHVYTHGCMLTCTCRRSHTHRNSDHKHTQTQTLTHIHWHISYAHTHTHTHNYRIYAHIIHI